MGYDDEVVEGGRDEVEGLAERTEDDAAEEEADEAGADTAPEEAGAPGTGAGTEEAVTAEEEGAEIEIKVRVWPKRGDGQGDRTLCFEASLDAPAVASEAEVAFCSDSTLALFERDDFSFAC